MRISCPVCDMSIEVSKFLVGQKGRCPRCSSKFIIPESPEDEMEILERGEIPPEEPAAAVPPPPPPPKSEPPPPAEAESAPAPVKAKPAAGGPRVMPATGAPVRTAPRPLVVKQSSSAFGFLFAIVLAALVGVIVYVMVDKQTEGGGEAVQNPPEKAEPKVVPPKRPPPPVVPAEVVDEPAAEGIAVYSKVLQPVFEAKCVECHGAEKAKGRLAMHTYEKLLAGSGNGSIVTADEDDASRIELIFRAELPESDEEHMPPQEKPQLTPDELAILKWWIEAGAHEDIDSNEAPEGIRQKIQDLAKL